MKKLFYIVCTVLLTVFSSCSNEDILVEIYNTVTITVDPSDLFRSYDYTDTYHNVNQLGERYRTFNSEYKKLIQVRTLFYDRTTESLVDSLVNYISNTNSITETITLPQGDYYAITTLTFADEDQTSWWVLKDQESLSTVKLAALSRFSVWSIMSHSEESFTLGDSPVTLQTTPKPLGAVIYQYYQNFQFVNESTYGTVGDNDIRRLAIYSQSRALSFNLNPNASNKFNYAEETRSNSWYYVDYHEPSMFDDSWTYFRTNLYSFAYLMEPSAKVCFGYTLKGENTFHAYGEATYSLSAGKTYLAYWDYFKLGNPYFGLADNNHWNTYSQTQTVYYTQPYSVWGASKATVKSNMLNRGYTLYTEDTDMLMYEGKDKEIASIYSFDSGKLWDVMIGFDASVASVSALRSFVNSLGFGYQSSTTNDGTTYYFYESADNKTLVAVYVNGNYSYVEYIDTNSLTSSARSFTFEEEPFYIINAAMAAKAYLKLFR